jgi:hypothetical protein
MVKYDRVLKSFSKFFDSDEILHIIENKVDVDTVQTLNEIKANKVDVEGLVVLIESLHKRLKHICIVQVEVARSMVPVKQSNNFKENESLNSKIQRREQLLKQA